MTSGKNAVREAMECTRKKFAQKLTKIDNTFKDNVIIQIFLCFLEELPWFEAILAIQGVGGLRKSVIKRKICDENLFLGNVEWSSNVMKLGFNVDWINQWYLCKNEASRHSVYFKKFWKMICDDEKTNA